MGCTASSASEGVSTKAVGKQTWTEQTQIPSTENVRSRKQAWTESTESAHSKYDLGEKIGRGSYGQVHFATTRKTHTEVAVKIQNLHPQKLRQEEDKVRKSSMKEVALWSAVGTHANCVQLHESFFDDHLAYMVMEKCDGSLFKYLQRREHVDETCIGKAFEHMLTGISHMHSVFVIHRDLKPDNFLVQGSTVKICDFGLSAMIPRSGFVEGIVGTAPYMPPEMLAEQQYDQKADVWSFGAVAYLLLCGEFPYKTCDGSARMMKKSILNGVEADCGRSWLTPNAVNFLQVLLTRRPEKRPTAALALQLPFIANPSTELLPSLHKVLSCAKKTGAFDSKDVLSVTETDVVLQKLRNGELENSPIFANVKVDTVSSTQSLKGADEKIPDKIDKVSCLTPQRSESTACGSSSYSSEASKLSSKSQQGK